MLKLISFFLLVAGASAFWTACSDRPTAGAPDRVESPFCGATTCSIGRGQTLTATAFFTPAAAHARLDVRATAFVLGVGVPLPIDPPHDNACVDLYHPTTGAFLGCPTTPGTRVEWRILFPIPTTFPTFSNSRVRFELLETNVVHMCTDITSVTLTA